MRELIYGAIIVACWFIGLFFARFYRETRDRLFAQFAAAFWVLSVDWLALALLPGNHPLRIYLYLVRAAAFLLILWAVIDKNRSDAG